MQSFSCQVPRVKRSRKTDVLPGLRRELNPKHGSDYLGETKQKIGTIQHEHTHYLAKTWPREAIPPLDGNYIKKQINLNSLHIMKSLSRHVPRVERSRKTDVLPGLWRELNTEQGGDYLVDVEDKGCNDSTSKSSLSSYC